MLRNYFKTAIRNIWRNKAYSFINIVGFALGMACTILIMMWVNDELGFDKLNRNRDRIYRIICDWSRHEWEGFDGTPEPLGQKAVEEIPEIEGMFRIASVSREAFHYDDRTFYEDNGIISDPAIFKMLTLPFINGNIETAFNGPDNLIISETLAKKYFGNSNPVGKIISINGELKTVTGVFKDIPYNSHLQFTYMYSFKYLSQISSWGRGWGAFNYVTYIQVKDNSDLQFIGEKLTSIGKHYQSPQVIKGVTFRLQPYSKIYLDAKQYSRSFQRISDSSYVFIFSIIALFVLFIACINFMNLSTARSMNRSLEVGMRKTIGAQRSQLLRQFLVESILLAFIAHIIAMIIVELFLPTFNQIAGKNISTNYLDFPFILSLLGAVILTGVLAGLYPAIYLSGFKPIMVLRKYFTVGPKSILFRKILVVVQFSLSIILIISTFIISKQLNYVSNMKLGFDKDNVLYIPMEENIPAKYDVLKSNLLNDPSILAVTAQQYNFIEITYRNAGFKWEGMNPSRERQLDLIYSGIDYDYFETLKIPLVAGRNFSKEISADVGGAIILNEAAIKDMGLKDPVGKWFDFGDGTHVIIIGIAKDVHIRTLKEEIEPRVFYFADLSEATEGITLIKIDGSQTKRTIDHIKNVWENINSITPFEYNFLNEAYDNLYKSEIRTREIFNYFTFLAVVISTLGLFGLASFSAEKRIKEVGIRKVMGASVVEILYLLVKDFSKWIVLANLFAWPVAYVFGKKLLENYAYKTTIGLEVYLISGIFALFIAIVTVGYKSFRAAVSNPVKALRYE
ncbi:MAG: hypothetical protein A2V66_07135 [Ignavibacteria bacterium RBG_13_36_8]|nr:MAG: hypothetical protein A2V66_07135 [Ignavibacteria bacterium RBG_13_36_8]